MAEKMEKDAAELPGISREAEEHQLAYVIGVAQEHLVQARKAIREANEDLADLMEVYDAKDKEGLTLWNNATARLKEYKRNMVRLEKARKKPYFGRIDFLAEEKQQKEAYYIGRVGISGDDAQPLVLDWRAPIASVYYESGLGPCSYTVLSEGTHTIDLERKRTYEIENDRLKDYFDSDVVANDELLTKYLAKSKKNVLGEIIATIQKEQNLLIRRSPRTNLIVQGVAGSGKTTVAMHRISYILYNYKEDFRPEDFYIIGSNKILLNYITGVLPELDVYGIRQMTMEELFIRLLYEEWNEKIYRVHPVSQEAWQEQKGSTAWFEKLEAYCQAYENQEIPQEAIVMEKTGVRLMRPAMIREYLRDNPLLSMESKILMLNKMLYARYENVITGKVISFTEKERKILDKKYSTYFGNGKWNGSVRTFYQDFLRAQQQEGIPIEIPDTSFDVYDLAAMAYIYKRIKETDPVREASHVVIDEAQDFGMMVYRCLHYCMRGCTYTVMGDTSQNIHFGQGLNDWEELRRLILRGTYDTFGLLRKSYRNTVEISEFATEVLRHGDFPIYPVEPIIRHGKQVKVQASADTVAMKDAAANQIQEWQKNGYETIAVICRDETEAKEVSDLLQDTPNLMSYTPERSQFGEGIMVLPVVYTKGLEFDAVLLWNPTKEQYPQDNGHIKLLYVAATRALHELTVLYQDTLTDIIVTEVPKEKHMQEFQTESLQKAKEYAKPVHTQKEIEQQRREEGDRDRQARGYLGPRKIQLKKEQEIAGTETPVLIPKPFEVHQALIPKNRNLLKKSTDKKLKSSAIDGLVNPSPYTYGTFPPESHLQVKGHSRGNFSVKWVKKTKQYLEIASAAGLLRLTPITPTTIRISFVKGVTGTIQDTNWKAQADTAVTWSAKESRSEVQLLTDRILIRVEKANGAVQFLSRDGKKLLTENPSEPRLLLDTQTWNFFAWDKNERLKSKGVLADDFMDLSTKARYISFGQKKLRMPLVLSNKGYAIGVAAGSTVLFCNVRTYGQYIYTQGTGQIDYYFIYDENQERIIEQYRNLPV